MHATLTPRCDLNPYCLYVFRLSLAMQRPIIPAEAPCSLLEELPVGGLIWSWRRATKTRCA
jgi:hypothetical protein